MQRAWALDHKKTGGLSYGEPSGPLERSGFKYSNCPTLGKIYLHYHIYLSEYVNCEVEFSLLEMYIFECREHIYNYFKGPLFKWFAIALQCRKQHAWIDSFHIVHILAWVYYCTLSAICWNDLNPARTVSRPQSLTSSSPFLNVMLSLT